MCPQQALLQALRLEFHQRSDFALLMKPPAERIQRPQPSVAAHRFHAALTQMDD